MSYDWQHEVYPLWRDNGYRGVIKAVTGSGKTAAGRIALQCYLADHPNARILVLTPRQAIKKQWEEELNGMADIKGYQQALSHYAQGKSAPYDVCIADECHNLLTDVQGRLIRNHYLPHRILGLSATPDGIEHRLGGVIRTVGYDEASVCPFTVHYLLFPLTSAEREGYDRWTQRMRTYAEKHHVSRPGIDRNYDFLTLKRRDFVYTLPSRIEHTLDLIRKCEGRRIMVFAERQAQLKQLSQRLDSEGIPHALHINSRRELDSYKRKEVDIILSVKMLQEGFNDPSTDTAILLSTSTTARSHIQTIGRVIRPGPGKAADVYVLLAKDTSDESVMKAVKFPKGIQTYKKTLTQ